MRAISRDILNSIVFRVRRRAVRARALYRRRSCSRCSDVLADGAQFGYRRREFSLRISIVSTSLGERLAGPALLRSLGDLFGTFRARDGSRVTWRGDDGASPGVRIAVAPVKPGHSVTLEIRIDGGPVSELVAAPEWRSPPSGERLYRALLPRPLSDGLEVLPVLRFAGRPVSPRLSERRAAPSARE